MVKTRQNGSWRDEQAFLIANVLLRTASRSGPKWHGASDVWDFDPVFGIASNRKILRLCHHEAPTTARKKT